MATTTSPTAEAAAGAGALGHDPPRYAHLPLLHGPDGKKLSKRHGCLVQELRDAGYLPAAIRNYLALLGWGTGDDTTLMSTEELVRRFRVEDVGKAAAIFDEKKLRWLNGRYMREMPADEYLAAVARHLGREPDERLREACAIAQEKAQTLEEVWPLIRFLFEPPVDDPQAWKKVMKAGVGGAARRRPPRRWPEVEPVEAGVDRGGAGPRMLKTRFEPETGPPLPADQSRDHRQLGLTGDLRVARGARPR